MPLFLLFYTLIGLVIGSFLNVCIVRLPRHQSVILPGSRCPHCGSRIRPYDNIPVLSYLWLRGKCRSCGLRISLQYPAVELLTGLAFLLCASSWGPAAPAFLNSLFLSGLIVLGFIDYQHQTLPNRVTLPGAVAGFLFSSFQARAFFEDPLTCGLASLLSQENPDSILPYAGSALGALIGAGFLFVVAFAYQVLRKRQGLGMGDVKMLAMVGSFLGWRPALLTIFVASLLGSILGVFLILFRGKNLQSRLAFGTFLGTAAALILFFGLPLIRWYAALR
mgnify:CR=1 FL=1